MHVLKWVAGTSDGWRILYVDPNDGRYWELTFPRRELQGGGPQRLRLLSKEDAVATFNLGGDFS